MKQEPEEEYQDYDNAEDSEYDIIIKKEKKTLFGEILENCLKKIKKKRKKQKMIPKYIVSPYKYIKIGGKRRASVSFQTKAKAIEFIKKRRLKHAILYVRKK